MSARRNGRAALALVLTIVLAGGLTLVLLRPGGTARTSIVGYFQNTNGLFRGDDVRILGVTVGRIDNIEPEPSRAKVTFWVDSRYKVPAEAKAVIMSPSLVTARTIQLVPAYTDGSTMADGAVIPIERTAVPVEWDDFRDQLQKLTATLQPTQPGGTSTFGALINIHWSQIPILRAPIHRAVSVYGHATGQNDTAQSLLYFPSHVLPV